MVFWDFRETRGTVEFPRNKPQHYITQALWGVPTASERGQSQRRPTSGQSGYITPGAWGVPTASKRRAETELAHKWARWLHNPCRLGGTNRFGAVAQSELAQKRATGAT